MSRCRCIPFDGRRFIAEIRSNVVEELRYDLRHRRTHVITELGITGRSHGLVDLQKNLSLRKLECFRRASIEFVLRYDHKLEKHLKSSNVQLVLTQDIEHLVERCVFH